MWLSSTEQKNGNIVRSYGILFLAPCRSRIVQAQTQPVSFEAERKAAPATQVRSESSGGKAFVARC